MGPPREAMQTEEGWDGYGAVPTTDAAVETAEKICQAWHPTSEGGLGIETEILGRGVWIEIGVDGKVNHVSLSVED
jgi:hypothetical protein